MTNSWRRSNNTCRYWNSSMNVLRMSTWTSWRSYRVSWDQRLRGLEWFRRRLRWRWLRWRVKLKYLLIGWRVWRWIRWKLILCPILGMITHKVNMIVVWRWRWRSWIGLIRRLKCWKRKLTLVKNDWYIYACLFFYIHYLFTHSYSFFNILLFKVNAIK